MALSPRAEILLKRLVELYISDGQPVSSRALAREAELELSAATIRNVMADLEEIGLIHSPHTSAGRIPTPQGYRVFVDFLLKVRPLERDTLDQIEGKISRTVDPSELLATASGLLSQVTHLAGIVTVPKRGQVRFRQMEFLVLSDNRVLVILVTDDGAVQNRVVSLDVPIEAAELVEAANFFNATYSGLTLQQVRQALLADLERESGEMHRLMKDAVRLAGPMLSARADEDLVVSGEDNLFDVPEWDQASKLRRLLETFKAKQDLLELLEKSMRANRIQIFIGEESGYQALTDCSVVTAPYEVDGRVVGTLGVIGPTRMSYDQVIPIVDITARVLSSALHS